MALAEVISLVKIGGAIVGSSVVTLLLAKWFGKKKEEIDIALNYQEYYGKLIEDMKAQHKSHIDKIEKRLKTLGEQVSELVKSKDMYEAEKQKFVMQAYEDGETIDRLEKQVKYLENGQI